MQRRHRALGCQRAGRGTDRRRLRPRAATAGLGRCCPPGRPPRELARRQSSFGQPSHLRQREASRAAKRRGRQRRQRQGRWRKNPRVSKETWRSLLTTLRRYRRWRRCRRAHPCTPPHMEDRGNVRRRHVAQRSRRGGLAAALRWLPLFIREVVENGERRGHRVLVADGVRVEDRENAVEGDELA